MTTKILVVDDDLDVLDGLQKDLSAFGYQVEACASSQEAMLKLSAPGMDYDVIVLDWMLESPNGSSLVIETARMSIPDFPVIVFTGDPNDNSPRAIQKGASWYVRKPFDLAELQSIIQSLTEQDANLHQIARTAQEIIGADQILIWRSYDQNRALKLAAWADPSSIGDTDKLEGIETAERNMLRIFREDTPSFLEEIRQSSKYHSPKFAARHSWNYMTAMPLRFRGKQFGLLESYWIEKDKFLAERQAGDARNIRAFARQVAESINNSEQAKKNRLLINGISSLAAEQPKLEIFTETILKLAVGLVGADEGWFYILDFGKAVLKRLNPDGGQKTALASQYQLDEVNLLCDAVREGTIKVVNDVRDPAKYNEHHPFNIRKYRSEAAIPLKRGEQTIGAVVLASRIPEAFLEMDIDSLRSFAMLSGSALDQAKLRFYLQHISQAVLKSQGVLQNAVIEAIHELLGKSVALWLLDEASDEFTVAASRGITETFKQKAHIKFTGADDSLLAHAFLTGQPVNCGDLQNPEEGLSVKLDSLLREENWRSTLLIPIFDSEGKPIGAIAIKRDVAGKFSQYEVDFLKNFTSQVAIAFENHRRRLSLSQQLEGFQEIIRTVGIEEADPLPVILEKAARLLDAHYGSFALLDLPNNKLEYRAVWENGRLLTGAQIAASRRYQSVSEGIVGYVARSKTEIYYAPDLSKEDEYYLQRYSDTLSELTLSLKNKQRETIGILNLESKWKNAFSPQQRELCQSLAQIAEDVIEKSQLFDRTEKLNQQLQVLHDMFQEGEFEAIQEQVLHGIINLYGSKTCSTSITLFDENSKRFLPTTVAVGPLAKELRFPPRREGGLAWHVAQHREPLFIENKNQLPPEIKDFNTELKKAGVNSSAVLPLKRQHVLLGVLFIHEMQETKYPPELRRFLQIYANQAAVIIENALTFDHRKKDLEALREVVNVIGSTSEPLPLVLEKTAQILEADHGHVSVVKDELLVHIAFWQDGRVVSGAQLPPDMRSIGKQEGISGQVVRTGKIYYAPDLDQKRKYYFQYFEDTRSELTLPLKNEDGAVIGVLNLESNVVNGFPASKQSLAESLAQIAADILNKQQLSRRLDLLNQQLDSLHEVTQSNTIDDIAERILNSINNILGVEVTSSSMLLYDQAHDIFTLCKAAGPLKDHLELPPRAKGGKARFMLSHRKPLFESDIMSPPDGAPRLREDSLKQNIKSSAILPLIHGTRLIGILFVHQTERLDFDDQMRNLLIRFADQAAVVLETYQLMKQQVNYLSTLQEINAAIGKEKLEHIYNKIVQQAIELTGGTASGLLILNQAQQRLEIRAWAGLAPKKKTLPLDHNSINGFVALTRRAYLCPDVSKDPHYFKWYSKIQSSLTIPMLYGNRVIGTLDVESTDLDAFTVEQRDLLQSLGNLAAIALTNAESYEKRVNDIVALGRINAAVGEKSPEEIQCMVVEEAVKLTGADYGVLWQLDGSGRQLDLLSIDGREAVEQTLLLEPDTVHGKVVTEKRGRIIDESDPEYRGWYPEIKSHLQVPMFAGEKLIGTLQVESTERNAFTDDQMKVLQALANQAGIAFEKDRWLKELEQLNKAGREISYVASLQPATTDLQEATEESKDDQTRLTPILQEATEQIKALLKTDATSIWLYDSPSGELVCEYATPDWGGDLVKGRRLEPGQGLAGWCFHHKENVITEDASKDGRHYKEIEEDTRAGLYSIVSVPLRSEDRVIGVLQVLHDQIGYFQQGHIALLEPLAAFTSNAIETARQIERVQFINELGNELTFVRTEPELYKIVHDRARKIMYTPNMFIALFEPKHEKQISFPMMFVNKRKLDQGELAKLARPFGKGLTEEVIHKRGPVLMKTRQEQEDWYRQQGENYIHQTFASWLGVPIMYANQVLGVIATYDSEDEHKFSEDDKQLLTLIAGQMAVALKNLREVNALQELSDGLLRETTSLWAVDPTTSIEEKI